MMKTLLVFFIILVSEFSSISSKLYPIEVKYPLLGTPAAPGSPWPMPKIMNGTSNKLYYFNQDDFKITTNMKIDCDIIEENKKIHQKVLFPPTIEFNSGSSDTMFSELRIQVESSDVCPGYPDLNMDESYQLKVSAGIATLKSNSVWGAIRGMETFSQLTYLTKDFQLAINDSTFIVDEPRFKYRGLMLDTARHYIPLPILYRQIDAMAYNKLNTFHWHIVDDQSFPFESFVYPDLTENGKYSQYHIYKQSDIKQLIEHARIRGIRVIPEFDSPGHVDSFGRTFPEFITTCWNDGKPFQGIYSKQAKAEIFNPTVEKLYPVLKNFLSELKSVFKDDYIHLGNDEVYYKCWQSNPNITEWMQKMNFSEYHQLEAYYTNRLLKITKNLGKKATVWQDVYDNGVRPDKDTYIQIWKNTTTVVGQKFWGDYLFNITRDGYKAILSSPWYINFIKYGYQEWYDFYMVDPLKGFKGTEEQAKLIIGGEACLWSEYVDGTNIEPRIWPRASTIAERLWSPAHVNSTEDAKFRLDEHRCRLLRRGIAAQPVLNGFCGSYEYGMKNSNIYSKSFTYGWPLNGAPGRFLNGFLLISSMSLYLVLRILRI